MGMTTQLNEKANVKRDTAADNIISGRKVISLEEYQVSTNGQTVITIGTFAVDVNQSKNLFVVVDGKILSEGASNDYTLTSISPNNTSNTISLNQSLIASLNIRLLYLGVVVTNSTSIETLSPAMSDWTEFTMNVTATGTNPTKGTTNIDKAYWRRVGDSMEIVWFYKQNGSGSNGTGTLLFGLPNGYSIDSGKADTAAAGFDRGHVGTTKIDHNSGAPRNTNYIYSVSIYDSTHLCIVATYTNVIENVDDNYAIFGYNQGAISMYARVPIAGWATNVIAQNSKVYRVADYAANGSNVTADPTALGQYRTYIKNSSALTGTDNAATAPFLPTNVDGFRIDGSVNYASGGTSGRPGRIEAFVGFNKKVYVELYSSAGRTGAIDVDVNPDTATTYYGVSFGYDPSTGVAFADAIDQPTATTSRFSGRSIPTGGGAPADAAYLYFDWIVSDNVLPVQYSDPSKVAENEVMVVNPTGYGSSGTAIRTWGVTVKNIGTAITYISDTTNGDRFVINEPGVYSLSYVDQFNSNVGSSGSYGWTLNSPNLSTGITSILNTTGEVIVSVRANQVNYPGGTAAATLNLKVGDVIRTHADGTASGTSSGYTVARVTKVANG